MFTLYEDIDGDNAYDIELPRGHDVKFNVIAVVDKAQIAMPYIPVTLNVPERHSSGGLRFFAVIGGLVVVFVTIAFCLYVRSKRMESQVDREVRQMLSAGGTSKV